LTCDNFFTDVELAVDLLGVNLTMVGTLRKNKRDIPRALLPNRAKALETSMFCFDNQLALVSYVPKPNRAVILLSSMHHDSAIVADNKNKPEIVVHYNETKSGVDNLDHLVRLCSVRCKTARWPLVMFFNTVDVAGVASFVVWTSKNPEWSANSHHRRRLYLKELARALVQPQLDRRALNPRSMKGNVRAAYQTLGIRLAPPPAPAAGVTSNVAVIYALVKWTGR